MNKIKALIEELENKDFRKRLEAIKALTAYLNEGIIKKPKATTLVNNHVHTKYSFSPYSPANAVWQAYMAGLQTVGMVDHDSINGAQEFVEAGKLIGIATTIGIEMRADFSSTGLNGKKINNPDQKSIAYIIVHGIPHTMIEQVRTFFLPYSAARNSRNRSMVNRINQYLCSLGIVLDFEKDVIPISYSKYGGAITERHLLYALAVKLVDRFGKGFDLINVLKNKLSIHISDNVRTYLEDVGNPYYYYDILGALKSDLLEQFYIDADEECPDIRDVISFVNKIGAISTYAYLGDVDISVTGDKKTQKFEDDYLDELFKVISELGFNAVTYAPSRNTTAQINRVIKLCNKHGLFQISGEDINSPRQPFTCSALEKPEFKYLVDATWALVGHEKAATEDISRGMFAPQTNSRYISINERIRVYSEIGKG